MELRQIVNVKCPPMEDNSDFLPVEGRFDLAQTLCCGQSFRWRELPDGSFEGVAQNEYARLRQEPGGLRFETPLDLQKTAFWHNYFDLDADYVSMQRQIAENPALRPALDYAGGIRILRQDGWEALASFILSQNNNIKRISGIIDRLCTAFGEPLENGYFGFPPPERLASLSLDELGVLRAGFRAKYLLDAARRVSDGRTPLGEIPALPLEQARAALIGISGVGPKVADCVLLFGFYRLECFPVDVWIGRALAEVLPQGLPAELAPIAGVAQQMLFHYMRTCPDRAQD